MRIAITMAEKNETANKNEQNTITINRSKSRREINSHTLAKKIQKQKKKYTYLNTWLHTAYWLQACFPKRWPWHHEDLICKKKRWK